MGYSFPGHHWLAMSLSNGGLKKGKFFEKIFLGGELPSFA